MNHKQPADAPRKPSTPGSIFFEKQFRRSKMTTPDVSQSPCANGSASLLIAETTSFMEFGACTRKKRDRRSRRATTGAILIRQSMRQNFRPCAKELSTRRDNWADC